MSKYIDKDRVLEYIIFGVVGKDITCGELTRVIESLPTIEVSEGIIGQGSGDINWQAVTSTGLEIYTKGYEDGRKSIEVSEDCISREYLKSFEYINKGDFNSVETIREWIDNAPSVVPSRAKGEWIYIDEPIVGNPYGRYRCSECEMEKPHKTDYCPNCGAKMKGQRGNE